MESPRTAPRRAARLAPLGAVLLVLPACQTEIFGGKDTYSERVEAKDYAQEKIDAGPRKGDVYGPNQRDPGASSVASFADALLAFQPKPGSVACLPLVNYDLKTCKPWVSELGLGTADAVARALRENKALWAYSALSAGWEDSAATKKAQADRVEITQHIRGLLEGALEVLIGKEGDGLSPEDGLSLVGRALFYVSSRIVTCSQIVTFGVAVSCSRSPPTLWT